MREATTIDTMNKNRDGPADGRRQGLRGQCRGKPIERPAGAGNLFKTANHQDRKTYGQAPISGSVEEGAAARYVTWSLNPEVEKGLMERARAPGVSLDDYLQELVAREAGLPVATDLRPIHSRFNNLSDLLFNSPFAGANLDLDRSKDHPRPDVLLGRLDRPPGSLPYRVAIPSRPRAAPPPARR